MSKLRLQMRFNIPTNWFPHSVNFAEDLLTISVSGYFASVVAKEY